MNTSKNTPSVVKRTSRENFSLNASINPAKPVKVEFSKNEIDLASFSYSDEEASYEIPVWIKGEQRFISGVNEETSCLDLIEALLSDEASSDCNENNACTNRGDDYYIAERWRRVEQALDCRTKILKIWKAWGVGQSEVKLTMKHRSDFQQQSQDSGRGSPTRSISSAIVRRRRHRASKSTFAWLTQGQTIHPKSQKNGIERLMKLILEQGEVIQQQLAKLRDHEIEIFTIEEERHRVREKMHGKNYLLETYLKGLPSGKKQDLGASDSGIHTEETAISPEIDVEHKKMCLLECENIASTKKMIIENVIELNDTKANDERIAGSEELKAQIDILENLIVINKHLHREEELCIRLGVKIKRYEAEIFGYSEIQVVNSLDRVNEQLKTNNHEISKIENQIKSSDEAISSKTDLLVQLYDELEETEMKHETFGLNKILPVTADTTWIENSGRELSQEYLTENIYNISKTIIKNGPQYNDQRLINDSFENGEELLSDRNTYHFSEISADKRIIQAQIHTIPINAQNSKATASVNYLEKINQRIQKCNQIETDKNNANNFTIQSTQQKIGPKKFLNINSRLRSNICKRNFHQEESNYLSKDDSMLGTLV